MYSEMLHAAAALASPGVALEDLQAQLFVGLRIKFGAGLFQSNSTHDAFSLARSRNAWRCG